MTNSIAMTKQSESKKNTQAAGYTLFTAILLVLAIIFIRWKIPENPVLVADNFVEISIADEPIQEFIPPVQQGGGGGGNPVQAIGDPGVAPPSPPAPGEEDSKDVETNDANKEEVAIKKPINPNPAAVKVNSNTPLPKPKEVPDPKPPAPQKPKSVYKGQASTGINPGGGAAEDYNRSGGSGNGNGVGTGNGAGGGNGNGAGGGNGNGTGPKNFGIKSFPSQSFEDEFNIPGKVAMDIVVNESGKVISATFQPRGSTGTATAQMKEIAKRRAFELKNFGTSPNGQKGTVIFDFKLKQ
jgi:hypothetical protein